MTCSSGAKGLFQGRTVSFRERYKFLCEATTCQPACSTSCWCFRNLAYTRLHSLFPTMYIQGFILRQGDIFYQQLDAAEYSNQVGSEILLWLWGKGLRGILPETNSSPLKTGRLPQKERIIFQASIFRCKCSFSGRVRSLNLANLRNRPLYPDPPIWVDRGGYNVTHWDCSTFVSGVPNHTQEKNLIRRVISPQGNRHL